MLKFIHYHIKEIQHLVLPNLCQLLLVSCDIHGAELLSVSDELSHCGDLLDLLHLLAIVEVVNCISGYLEG
jgi:hypothetical protein